jgi:hypothetical protein
MSNKYIASTKLPQPRSEIVGRPVTGPKPINKNPDPYLGPLPPPYDGTHISPTIRSELGKLDPKLAAGVRSVADQESSGPKPRARQNPAKQEKS